MNKNCMSCGHELQEDALFCMKCGQKVIEVACGQCGKALPSDAKFCGYCGQVVGATPEQSVAENIVDMEVEEETYPDADPETIFYEELNARYLAIVDGAACEGELEELEGLAEGFESLGNYEDASEKNALCQERISEIKYTALLRRMEHANTIPHLRELERDFEKLGHHAGALAQRKICQEKIKQLEAVYEKEEAEKKEQRKIAAKAYQEEERKKRVRRVCIGIILCVVVGGATVLGLYMNKEQKYSAITNAIASAEYGYAQELIAELGTYKESEALLTEALLQTEKLSYATESGVLQLSYLESAFLDSIGVAVTFSDLSIAYPDYENLTMDVSWKVTLSPSVDLSKNEKIKDALLSWFSDFSIDGNPLTAEVSWNQSTNTLVGTISSTIPYTTPAVLECEVQDGQILVAFDCQSVVEDVFDVDVAQAVQQRILDNEANIQYIDWDSGANSKEYEEGQTYRMSGTVSYYGSYYSDDKYQICLDVVGAFPGVCTYAYFTAAEWSGKSNFSSGDRVAFYGDFDYSFLGWNFNNCTWTSPAGTAVIECPDAWINPSSETQETEEETSVLVAEGVSSVPIEDTTGVVTEKETSGVVTEKEPFGVVIEKEVSDVPIEDTTGVVTEEKFYGMVTEEEGSGVATEEKLYGVMEEDSGVVTEEKVYDVMAE